MYIRGDDKMNYIKLTNFDNELVNQIFSYNVLQKDQEQKEENKDELLLRFSETQSIGE